MNPKAAAWERGGERRKNYWTTCQTPRGHWSKDGNLKVPKLDLSQGSGRCKKCAAVWAPLNICNGVIAALHAQQACHLHVEF